MTSRTPSILRLSEMPDADVGEAAARAVTGEDHGPRTELKPGLPLETPEAAPVHVTMPAMSGGSDRTVVAPPPPASSRPARSSSPSGTGGFSFSSLFPTGEQSVVEAAETSLSLGDPAAAVLGFDQLVTRALASGAALAGSAHDAPRDPALVALLLGIEPRRYLKFRALVREARAGQLVSTEAALFAYAFVLDMRRALRDVS
jgi:hypothetical protein